MSFSLFLCLVILGMCCGAYERDRHARAEVKPMSPLGGTANHTRLQTWNNTKPAVLHSLLWLSASSFLAFFTCISSPALRMDHDVGWLESRKYRNSRYKPDSQSTNRKRVSKFLAKTLFSYSRNSSSLDWISSFSIGIGMSNIPLRATLHSRQEDSGHLENLGCTEKYYFSRQYKLTTLKYPKVFRKLECADSYPR